MRRRRMYKADTWESVIRQLYAIHKASYSVYRAMYRFVYYPSSAIPKDIGLATSLAYDLSRVEQSIYMIDEDFGATKLADTLDGIIDLAADVGADAIIILEGDDYTDSEAHQFLLDADELEQDIVRFINRSMKYANVSRV